MRVSVKLLRTLIRESLEQGEAIRWTANFLRPNSVAGHVVRTFVDSSAVDPVINKVLSSKGDAALDDGEQAAFVGFVKASRTIVSRATDLGRRIKQGVYRGSENDMLESPIKDADDVGIELAAADKKLLRGFIVDDGTWRDLVTLARGNVAAELGSNDRLRAVLAMVH